MAGSYREETHDAGPTMRAKTKSPAGPGLLSIGALSRATGIPADTLRTWERRYGMPSPERKPSGHRLYPASLVAHLRRVAVLLSQGHRPGDILTLSPRQIASMLSLDHRAAPQTIEAAQPTSSVDDPHASIELMLDAASHLEREPLIRELRANWTRRQPLEFLEQIVGPFLTEVGRAWRAKRIEIRHEHFASACVSDFLREVREPFDRVARGPRVAVALLPGDLHEGGLLMVSVLLASRGYRVVYLGANVPVDQIAAAATGGAVVAVAISVPAGPSRIRAAGEISELRRRLPSRVGLWIGGAGAPTPSRGVMRFESLLSLSTFLANRTAAS